MLLKTCGCKRAFKPAIYISLLKGKATNRLFCSIFLWKADIQSLWIFTNAAWYKKHPPAATFSTSPNFDCGLTPSLTSQTFWSQIYDRVLFHSFLHHPVRNICFCWPKLCKNGIRGFTAVTLFLAVRQEDGCRVVGILKIVQIKITSNPPLWQRDRWFVTDRRRLITKPAPIIPDLASDTGNGSNPCPQIIHNGRKDLGLGLIDAAPGMRSREANFPAIW